MGEPCNPYGGEERCIQCFGGETWRPMRGREDNIKMNIQEEEYGVWTASSWLRIGTGGGHL